MLQPTECPPASLAPRLAPSMMPGPPPVITVKPPRVRGWNNGVVRGGDEWAEVLVTKELCYNGIVIS